jgi:hypothetical protein
MNDLESITDIFEPHPLADVQEWPGYEWCTNCGTMIDQHTGEVRVPKMVTNGKQ